MSEIQFIALRALAFDVISLLISITCSLFVLWSAWMYWMDKWKKYNEKDKPNDP